MLLQEFWNGRFWPHCTRNLRESTWVGYESAWRLHVMPVFGGMDMSAISVELVDKWLACFDSAGAARKAWAVLRAILRRAIRWNLLDVDITRRDIQLPSTSHEPLFCAPPLLLYFTTPSVWTTTSRWLAESMPLHGIWIVLSGRSPSGTVPSGPVPHESPEANSASTWMKTILPTARTHTLSDDELWISCQSVGVRESYDCCLNATQ